MDHINICPGCFNRNGSQNHCSYCGYEEKGFETSLYLPPGTLLSDKYLTGKVLGQGGFGITYLGWDLNLDIRLAIKEFFPQGMVSRLPGQSKVVSLGGDGQDQYSYGLERFLNEAKTLASFEHHPNIVTVRDFFKANNTAYMVMSYLEGLTLEQYLIRQGGKIPFPEALSIIMPVLDALIEVHREEIMHRDISPDNIIIGSNGRIVLIDFGAARQELRAKSKSLSVILKAGYAPEEQYRSRGKQGPWTDIYAVGATIYRALTGQVPLEAMDRLVEDDLKPPSQLGVEIDPAREKVLLKSLAVRAIDRYQVTEDFQASILQGADKTDKPERLFEKGVAAVAGNHYAKPQSIRGEDIEKEILLSRLEAEQGTERSIIVELDLICIECGGTGLRESSTCSYCRGRGLQQVQKGLNVNIPAGVIEGTRICIEGEGIKGLNGGENGDLSLVIRIELAGSENGIYSNSFQPNIREVEQNAENDKPQEWQESSEAQDSSKKVKYIAPDSSQRSKLLKFAVAVIVFIVLVIGVINLYRGLIPAQPGAKDGVESLYYINYENGLIPISDLPIGARVVDPTWQWEFRTGNSYSSEPGDVTKPITWIIVAKNHYQINEAHVTLLSEELIGKFPFDDSTNRGSQYGDHHWGNSGHPNASRGLRPWLNSTDIHEGEGLYQAFSPDFRQAVLATNVPNSYWDANHYITADNVFIPSSQEVGDDKYKVMNFGSRYPYFAETIDSKNPEDLGIIDDWYWTRSIDLQGSVRRASGSGEFYHGNANRSSSGVRPVLNIRANVMVSEMKP